jgi:hypothetical protein
MVNVRSVRSPNPCCLPRPIIRIEVEEVSAVAAELFIVLHGYKMLGY